MYSIVMSESVTIHFNDSRCQMLNSLGLKLSIVAVPDNWYNVYGKKTELKRLSAVLESGKLKTAVEEWQWSSSVKTHDSISIRFRGTGRPMLDNLGLKLEIVDLLGNWHNGYGEKPELDKLSAILENGKLNNTVDLWFRGSSRSVGLASDGNGSSESNENIDYISVHFKDSGREMLNKLGLALKIEDSSDNWCTVSGDKTNIDKLLSRLESDKLNNTADRWYRSSSSDFIEIQFQDSGLQLLQNQGLKVNIENQYGENWYHVYGPEAELDKLEELLQRDYLQDTVMRFARQGEKKIVLGQPRLKRRKLDLEDVTNKELMCEVIKRHKRTRWISQAGAMAVIISQT